MAYEIVRELLKSDSKTEKCDSRFIAAQKAAFEAIDEPVRIKRLEGGEEKESSFVRRHGNFAGATIERIIVVFYSRGNIEPSWQQQRKELKLIDCKERLTFYLTAHSCRISKIFCSS